MRHSPTLFTAVLLLLFLGGINVAQGDDKPTSKDLGKIQPPGGAPLRPGEPGTEISVDFLKKASKRLEAAPQEDLDKWVVELERIMDRKLDGELEKEGCCTYFVTRVSVAFDDLKWNAKTADNLFKRAQTMPASEAKVWKEAFEALSRMKQLTADDISLWGDKVDEFGGTKLDAAVNIILLDDYFDKENFQRDKFKAAIGARKK
jgi:hypothetical protein